MEYYHRTCRSKVDFCTDKDYGTRFYVCRLCGAQIQDEESTVELVYLKHISSIHLLCGRLIEQHHTHCEFCKAAIEAEHVRMEYCFTSLGG